MARIGKRKVARIALLALAAAVAVSAAVSVIAETLKEKRLWTWAAGTINGEPFTQADLDVYARELRAAIAQSYGRKYGLSGMGASFWDTEFDGVTPRQRLNRIGLDDLTRNIVLMQEARKRGVDAPAAYTDLEAERAVRNAPTDEIVYGPKTLEPAEFNSYRITGITNDLKTALLKKELKPTTAQLRASFESLPDSVKVAPYKVSGKVYIKGENGEEKAEEFVMESRYISKEDPYEQQLMSALENSYVGAVVPAPDGSEKRYVVERKEGGGLLTFEEAPALGRNKWINDEFDRFLASRVKAAKIKLAPGMKEKIAASSKM